MVKNHADSNLTPKFLGSILIWKGQVPFQRNHSRFSWCFTCQATFGNFDPYEALVVDQVAAAFGYGLNNKDEGYFYSNNQVRVEPEEVVKLKTWSWSHLGWCFFVELQRPDEQSVFTMAWSLWFFPVLILVAAVLYFLSLMFFWFCIFFGLVGELNLWTWWVFSDLELKLWISRDTIPRGRVQHCCTPSREFGRISYLMGNIWLQRQLFSQKAVEACWGYKWAQEKIFLIFPSGVFLKQWDVAAGILAGLQKNWAAAHLPKTVEPEVTGKTVRPQRDFGSLAQQLLRHCRRIWGAEVVCSECKMVRFL